KSLFKLAGLKACTHQNRDLAKRVASSLQGLDLVPYPAGLLFGVPQGANDDLVALVCLGPQGLAEPAAVLRDHSARRPENVRGRAVILFEPSDDSAREILFKAQDVADFGAAPTVDRLIVVADAAQIASFLRQEAQPEILRDVGVLVFVDEQ